MIGVPAYVGPGGAGIARCCDDGKIRRFVTSHESFMSRGTGGLKLAYNANPALPRRISFPLSRKT